jgi:hypothetical protein
MRLIAWPELLADFIESRRAAPFEWGKNDCCLFCADAVLAMTGEDPATAYRGKYSTDLGARKLIKKGAGMRGLCPWPSKPAGFAQRGDIVLADMEGMETLGIVVGNGMWCAPGKEGLLMRPMSEAIDVIEL